MGNKQPRPRTGLSSSSSSSVTSSTSSTEVSQLTSVYESPTTYLSDLVFAPSLRDRDIERLSATIDAVYPGLMPNLSCSGLLTSQRKGQQKIVVANAQFASLTGYHPTYFLNKNCRFLQGPETDQEVVEALRNSIRAGVPIHVQILNYRNDGTPFLNALMMFPLRCSQRHPRKITHFFALQKDISLETHLLKDAYSEQTRQIAASKSLMRVTADDVDLPVDKVELNERDMLIQDAVRTLQRVVCFSNRLDEFIPAAKTLYPTPRSSSRPAAARTVPRSDSLDSDIDGMPGSRSGSQDSQDYDDRLSMSPSSSSSSSKVSSPLSPWMLSIIVPKGSSARPIIFDEFPDLVLVDFDIKSILCLPSTVIVPCTATAGPLYSETFLLQQLEQAFARMGSLSALLQQAVVSRCDGFMNPGETIVATAGETIIVFVCLGLTRANTYSSAFTVVRSALSTVCKLLRMPLADLRQYVAGQPRLAGSGGPASHLSSALQRVFLPAIVDDVLFDVALAPAATPQPASQPVFYNDDDSSSFSHVSTSPSSSSGPAAEQFSVPDAHAAHQMRVAYQRVCCPQAVPQPLSELDFDLQTELQKPRRRDPLATIAKYLSSGTLLQRGLCSRAEAHALVTLIEEGSRDANDPTNAAAVAAAALLSSPKLLPPIVAIRLRRAITASKRAFDQCLNVGTLRFFREISPKDILISTDLLGHGASASVAQGLWQNTQVAVKIFRVEDYLCLLGEFNMMALLSHPHLVSFHGAHVSLAVETGNFSLAVPPSFAVMELCEGGSVYLQLRSAGALSCAQYTPMWALHVARALDYLHQIGVMHRDIKSPNVLLSKDLRCAKLCDYGLARSMERSPEMTALVGSKMWMAPEQLKGANYGLAAEIWAYGMFIYELMTANIPYEHLRTPDLASVDIINGKPPLFQSDYWQQLPSNLKKPFEKVYKACTEHKPSKRPTSSQLVQLLVTLFKPT